MLKATLITANQTTRNFRYDGTLHSLLRGAQAEGARRGDKVSAFTGERWRLYAIKGAELSPMQESIRKGAPA